MTTEIKPKKPYPCIESTVDFYYGNSLIRLWIDENFVLENENDYDVDHIVRGITVFLQENKSANPKQVAEYVASNYARVNAMQIKDDDGVVQKGVVIYFKEFSEDQHG